MDVPWPLPEPEPTNVVALWSGASAPTASVAVETLGRGGGGENLEVLEPVDHDDPQVAWCIAARHPRLRAPIVLWCEPAQPMTDEACRALGVPACRWIVGAETLLDTGDPLTEYVSLMRGFLDGRGTIPAVLDVNTTRWFTRGEIINVFAQEIEPPADVMWIVQGVRRDDDGGGCVWLHTHGLWRCGAPELEMLDVAGDWADAAAELLNDVAGLVLEGGAPAPDTALEIGTGLHVVLRPWQEVVPGLGDDVPGGPRDREGGGDNAHVGARAVVCADRPHVATQRWVWPEEAARRLAADEAGVYRARRETRRQASLARASWARLREVFDRVTGNGVVFAVKAGFADESDPTSREHLWFEVERFEPDRAYGRLLNQPLAVRSLVKGTSRWIARGDVSDWRVMTPDGAFGPSAIDALCRAIDARGAADAAGSHERRV